MKTYEYPSYLLREDRKLIFCSSKWAIILGLEYCVIQQMGPFGPSTYAFWWPKDKEPRPADWHEVPSYKTNYPTDKIPKYVLAKAKSALNKISRNA